MCGIAGLVDWRADTPGHTLQQAGEAMIETLRHRGPDAGAVWVSAEQGIVLGQRRLAIIDLSPTGAQPMHSADGRYAITFNGEIYNYRDIRRDLESGGRALRGNSDTEVLIEACALWGVERAIERTIGMFAFALWDRQARTLVLARDRLGIKPLYYAAISDRVLFASQLKAFRALPNWKPSIDADAVANYLRYAYIPQPQTIYNEARKLPPGHILKLHPGSANEPKPFWDLRAVAAAGQRRNDPKPDAQEAVEHLDKLLRDAVRLRMIADVPLGAFLSGGIDSSTVVALMQTQSVRPVKTFSIGFHETHYDEAECAKRVAAHLDTDHTEFYVEPCHAIEVIPKLPDWFDEPFADASQIPTYLLSELTRRHVTVALTGDGGDEVFGGYNRYYWVPVLARLLNVMPRPLCKFWAHGLQAARPEVWDRIFGSLPSAWRPAQPGDKVHKLAKLLASPGVDAIYRRLVSQWDEPREIVTNAIEPYGAMSDRTIAQEFPDPLARMQLMDMLGYLPEDILTKVDRATMAVGLEGRVPLIDHRVVTYAWSLPPAFKVRLTGRKWLLRQVLSRYVPSALVDRPKMGFGVPIGAWLRGPLREWADDLLSPARLRDYGLVRVEPVRHTWLEHLSGHRNWDHRIWTVLMLQAWRQRWA